MNTVPIIGISRHRLATDGKGVTTLVAFHGCPLRCKYCLNPQSLQPAGIWKHYDCLQVYEEVKMELKEFELFLNGTIMKFGDIVIDKCTVKKETDASTFTGQQNLTFSGDAAALGTCATTVEGTVESGALTMNINVKVATLQQTVKVTYSGVKQVEESGND